LSTQTILEDQNLIGVVSFAFTERIHIFLTVAKSDDHLKKLYNSVG